MNALDVWPRGAKNRPKLRRQAMNAVQNVVLVLIIFGFAAAEFVLGRYKDFHATPDDGKLELFMFVSLLAITQPLIFAITGKAAALWFPQFKDAWAGMPWWAMVAILLVGDDMTQYWWHRLSH